MPETEENKVSDVAEEKKPETEEKKPETEEKKPETEEKKPETEKKNDGTDEIWYKFPSVSLLHRELQFHKFASDPIYILDKPVLEIAAKKFCDTTKEHHEIRREAAQLVEEYYVGKEKKKHYNYELSKIVLAGALIDIGKELP